MELNARIEEISKHQRLTSSQFADTIGVQRSSMSHIISGRNKPSLDFVQKVLEHFKFINTEWLLFGRGPMVKEMKQQSLFDFSNNPADMTKNDHIPQMPEQTPPSIGKTPTAAPLDLKSIESSTNDQEIERIVVFYKNGYFESYTNKK